MYILRSHSFSALCNGTCQILRVFSYTLCPSYLSLLTFILALASRVLCASFNLILQHPFPNCPSALRSRPLVFSFSFVETIYKGQTWNIDWLQPIRLDAQPLRMDDDFETTGMALLVCASIGPGSLYILLPPRGTHFSPPLWTLGKKILPWCTLWAGPYFEYLTDINLI